MTNALTNDNTRVAAHYTNKSIFTGIVRTIEMPQYTPEEFENKFIIWKKSGILIQDAFPELSDYAREFIMTGMTPDEWNEYMG
jgi:hypothetical protein